MTAMTTTVVEAQFLAAVSPGGAFLPPTLPEVAFAGRSNVGKSSLINTLTGRKSLARTSSTPGCTRSINFFHIRAADGLNFQLVDLPGYGYAKRSKAERAAWGPLLERYLLERAPLRAVVLLVDVRRGLEDEEEELLEFLNQPGAATRPAPGLVLVATKIDKLPLAQRHGALARLKRAGVGAIGFSSVTRDGVEPLWKRLRFYLLGGDEAPLLTDAAPTGVDAALPTGADAALPTGAAPSGGSRAPGDRSPSADSRSEAETASTSGAQPAGDQARAAHGGDARQSVKVAPDGQTRRRSPDEEGRAGQGAAAEVKGGGPGAPKAAHAPSARAGGGGGQPSRGSNSARTAGTRKPRTSIARGRKASR